MRGKSWDLIYTELQNAFCEKGPFKIRRMSMHCVCVCVLDTADIKTSEPERA